MENLSLSEQLDKSTERADLILKNVGLSWDDLEGKKVLDIASGDSDVAKASALRNSSAEIFSADIQVRKSWREFPWGNATKPVQADAGKLPFDKDAFDFVIMHGFNDDLAVIESARVLKSGGELRVFPIAGQTLEFWYISYYLDKVKNVQQRQIIEILENYDRQIFEADGWMPNEYVDLREKALDGLTQDQKIEVIGMMATRYSQNTGIPFSYEVKDPDAREPNARLVYKKKI